MCCGSRGGCERSAGRDSDRFRPQEPRQFRPYPRCSPSDRFLSVITATTNNYNIKYDICMLYFIHYNLIRYNNIFVRREKTTRLQYKKYNIILLNLLYVISIRTRLDHTSLYHRAVSWLSLPVRNTAREII